MNIGIMKPTKFLHNFLDPENQINTGKNIINSYFEHIASEYIKYDQKKFLFRAKYIERSINKSPYKNPYEYGNIILKTFGERTAVEIMKMIIPNPKILSRYFSEIL